MKLKHKFIIYISLLVVFSFIYYSLGKGELQFKDKEGMLNTYLDCLHFSIITQTTVGYGHVYPKTNLSKMIVNVQCLSTAILLLF